MNHLTAQSSDTQAVEGRKGDRVDSRSASRLAWGLWLLVVLVEGLLVAFLLGNDALSAREWIGALATWVPFLAFATVGAMILARRPGNRSGWLCWAIGFAFTLSGLSSRQLWEVLTDNQDWSAAWALAAQLGTVAYLGTLLGLLPFLILLFPTGRLLSPRWRPVAWTLGLIVGLYLTARLLMPGPVSPGLPVNPLGLESAEGLLQLIQAIAGVAPILVLAVVASLVVRFRRSRGDERQQLKWLTYVVAVDVAVPWTVGVAAERFGAAAWGAGGLPGGGFDDPDRDRGGRPEVSAVRHRSGHQPHPGLRAAHGAARCDLRRRGVRHWPGLGPRRRSVRARRGRLHPGRGCAIPAGPPPHPADG
jgi:hypothetical protein